MARGLHNYPSSLPPPRAHPHRQQNTLSPRCLPPCPPPPTRMRLPLRAWNDRASDPYDNNDPYNNDPHDTRRRVLGASAHDKRAIYRRRGRARTGLHGIPGGPGRPWPLVLSVVVQWRGRCEQRLRSLSRRVQRSDSAGCDRVYGGVYRVSGRLRWWARQLLQWVCQLYRKLLRLHWELQLLPLSSGTAPLFFGEGSYATGKRRARRDGGSSSNNDGITSFRFGLVFGWVRSAFLSWMPYYTILGRAGRFSTCQLALLSFCCPGYVPPWGGMWPFFRCLIYSYWFVCFCARGNTFVYILY